MQRHARLALFFSVPGQWRWRLLNLCSIAALLFTSWDNFAAPAPADRLDDVNDQIRASRAWLNEARKNEVAATKALREAETALDEAKSVESRLAEEASALRLEADALGQQVTALSERHDQLRLQQAEELRVLHRTQGGNAIKTLLSQDDPARLPRMMALFRYLDRARQETLVAIQETSKNLGQSRITLDAHAAQLQAKLVALSEETRRIEGLRRERQQALASLRKDISERGGEVKELEEERRQLQSLLRELERAAARRAAARAEQEARSAASSHATTAPPRRPEATGTPTGPMGRAIAGPIRNAKGKLPWPTQGRVGARFGSPKSGTRLRWEGLLINAPAGTRVHAIHGGEVVFSGWLRGFGTMTIVDHGQNLMSLYAHLDRALLTTGDRVNGGQAIGEVGLSGGRTTPALYFELRDRGSPVDPGLWLAKK